MKIANYPPLTIFRAYRFLLLIVCPAFVTANPSKRHLSLDQNHLNLLGLDFFKLLTAHHD